MTASVGQFVLGDNTSSTVPAVLVVMGTTLVGSGLEVLVGMVSNSSVSGIADTQGNTFTKLQEVLDATANWKVEHWAATGIIGGADTITATFSFSAGNRSIAAKEVREVTAVQTYTAANPATPTTSTDALTSGTATVSTQPALISGFAVSNSSISQPSAGTGFTSDSTAQAWYGFSYGYRAESKRTTSTGSQAATFTASANERHAVLMSVWTEVVASTGIKKIGSFNGGMRDLTGGING